MTVNELILEAGLKSLVLADGSREVTGVYIGDLLSWVMGKASYGDAWITIMTNVNILAVASLTDTACIILAEDVIPEADVIKTAEDKQINLLVSKKSIYDTAVSLSHIL